MSKLGTKLTTSNYVKILSTPSTQALNLHKEDQQGVITTRIVLRTTCNKLACFENLVVLANYGENVETNRSQNNVMF